jgi:riboflavin biosynthesis pyrimidine reductase
MTTVTCNISTSVDGFVAGPRQSLQNPIGEGGARLHDWHLEPEDADLAVIDEWLEQAKAAAGGKNVEIAGGASTINAYLQAGAIDELHMHIAPIVLGVGERLFADVSADLRLEPVQAISSPRVTHITYRVG